MRFFAIAAALATIVGTQASPILGLGNLFHHPHNSTSGAISASAGVSATRSARFPSSTSTSIGHFNLTQVLEEHHVDLSNLRGLNVTRLLGEFGITLPANLNLDSIVEDLENRFGHHHNTTRPSRTRSSGRPSSTLSASATSSVSTTSTFVPSSISSASLSASDSISLPVISASASASADVSTSTSAIPSAVASSTISASGTHDEDAGIPGPSDVSA
ncbi:uncharacterized protein I303_107949 [Kwoniella dejecticola CBS 10117]|uniref:Uncharacterized protein n=1 Tax=Kwoniella dejecticola CBS 10117 TaxID=1296121 RepID=A0A1A5ZW42_9TREE|nr:uncharacterized protein I303_07942 [Kwoniella dejecticola CBS 10117]OBR82028.1 hypothetical protein I303_07942 [Kwoniella dejecticola CBS 10117]